MWRQWIGTAAIVVLVGVSTFGQAIPPGALSSNKPVFMGGKQVATTGAGGDLLLALDSTKNYVVLHQSCSRYEIVLQPSDEESRCQQDDGRNENGCRQCEVAGYISGGAWKPATPQSAPSTGDALDRFTFHVNAGVAATTFTNAGEACGTITQQLTGLGYNQGVVCTTDNSDIGGAFGGGVTAHLSPNVGIYGGIQHGWLGESVHAVDQAGRINVPGSISNLLFSVTNTNAIELFNIEAGASVGNKVFSVLPFVTYGRASIVRTVTDRLLAAAPGPVIPTTQVAGSTTTVNNAVWGFGWGVRAAVYPGGGPFGLIGEYQQRTINEAFAPDDSGRNPPNFDLRWFHLGLGLRF